MITSVTNLGNVMNNKDHETYRDILTVYERRSTCARIRVACVLVKNGRILVSGWNGVISGKPHCCQHFAGFTQEQMLSEHHDFSLNNELHAEANCIAYAAKHGIAVLGSDAYVTYSPCLPCAHSLAASGIQRVFYKTAYDRDAHGVLLDYITSVPVGVSYLRLNGVQVEQLELPQKSGDQVCT